MNDLSVAQESDACVWVIQGDDALAKQEAVHGLIKRHCAGSPGEMNLSRLDAAAAARAEISTALGMLPLGGEKRLVVLDQALEAAKGRDGQAWLEGALKALPESTVLALVVHDSQKYRGGRMVWQAVGEGHWLHQALEESGKFCRWLELPLPTARDMPGWIMVEVKRQGGEFEPGAAAELARLIGSDTLLARSEVAKALSFTAGEGKVTRSVVRLLCSPSREEDVFKMLDAVGKRDARTALGMLGGLLRDQPIQYVFMMLVRQARLLMMAKEVLAEGGGEPQVIAESGVHSYVAGKLMEQSRHFRMEELEGIYRQLDRMDEGAKTGHETLEISLETLIAELSRKG